MKDLSGHIKKRRCDRLDEWSMDSLADAADELECCIEGKDKEILELDIKLNNSIHISKLEELKELFNEAITDEATDFRKRLQTIIDETKK